uniref:Uncharacterized protein n=1 Tax=Myotis myotis TaxID=51298 RepID=A0A7J7UD00_MYOMY|nr:hypothetical protein mMyoMyo1_008792 [Myotis myotis]
MAASEEPEAPTEPLDVACGLENVPVSVWPPGARPGPFQVSLGRSLLQPVCTEGPGASQENREFARRGPGPGPGSAAPRPGRGQFSPLPIPGRSGPAQAGSGRSLRLAVMVWLNLKTNATQVLMASPGE